MEPSEPILKSFHINCAKIETIVGVVFLDDSGFFSNTRKEGIVHDLSMLQTSNNFDPDFTQLILRKIQ